MGRFHYIDGIPYRLVLDKETGATLLEPVPSMNLDHEQMMQEILRVDPAGYESLKDEAEKLFDFLFEPGQEKPASPRNPKQLCEVIALYMAQIDAFWDDPQFRQNFLKLLRILCRNMK